MSQTVIVQEVQIDFDAVHDAKVMERFVKSELHLNCVVTENPIMLCVYDVPENRLGAIRRRCAMENFSKGTVKIINSTRDAVLHAADFAAYRVVAPVAQAGIKATTGIAKVAAKTALATGATLIGSVLENTRRTASELKSDPEVIHAKQELSCAYGAIKALFGSKGDSKQIRCMNSDNIITVEAQVVK